MGSRFRVAAVTFVLVAGVSWAGLVFAQPSGSSPNRKESLATLNKLSSSFDVRLDERRLATRDAEPAIRWTNTIGHTTDAALFFWMHNGRPFAVGTTFVTDQTSIAHEFQSLALEPLVARRGEKTIWEPRQPGITFRPLPDAPQPDESPRGRLSQMKSLARRFRAQAIKSPPFYQDEDARELRLLAHPIRQYHEPDRPEQEGAVFAFAMDTDVDVLLLIENRVRDGKAGWEYAVARSNPFVLKVWCDKVLVWSLDRLLSISDPAEPYLTVGPLPVKDDGDVGD